MSSLQLATSWLTTQPVGLIAGLVVDISILYLVVDISILYSFPIFSRKTKVLRQKSLWACSVELNIQLRRVTWKHFIRERYTEACVCIYNMYIERHRWVPWLASDPPTLRQGSLSFCSVAGLMLPAENGETLQRWPTPQSLRDDCHRFIPKAWLHRASLRILTPTVDKEKVGKPMIIDHLQSMCLIDSKQGRCPSLWCKV